MKRKTKKQGPGIFTPWKMVGALLTLGPVIVWIVFLTLILPDEVILRVEIRADGSRAYYLQELKAAILGVTWMPVLGISGFFGIRFAVRKQLHRHGIKVEKTDWSKVPRWFVAALAIGGCLFLWLVLIGIVVVPFSNLRTVIIQSDSIEFQSLYWSWTIRRDEVQDAIVMQQLRRARGGPMHDVHLVVTTKSGAHYQTMASSWNIPWGVKPEDLGDHMRLLKALKADIADQ